MNYKHEIIFWQNIVSPHQSFFLEELAKLMHVTLIVEEYMSKERESQGWEILKLKNVKIVKIKDKQHLSTLINDSLGKINVFSGFFSTTHANIELASKTISKYQKIYIITECPILLGRFKILKFLKYKYLYLKNKNKVEHIFAMGNLGKNFFLKLGFNSSKITPFQYFVEPKLSTTNSDLRRDNTIKRYIFVGQFILRKGVDNLVSAFNNLQENDDWTLNLVGSGELEQYLKTKVLELGLENNVKFLGNLSNSNVRSQIEQSDYLVLPSRFDGWGAVISEALSVGTKVICSDKCGASILVNAENGYVYDEKSDIDLVKNLKLSLKNNAQNRDEIVDKFNSITEKNLNDFIIIINKIDD